MERTKLKCTAMLFTTAFIWGLAFVSQSKGMEYMKPLTFMAARNILAALFLLPVVICKLKKGEIDIKQTLKGGILCGIVLVAADFCQQYGITMTSVGKTGFITTLYIIFTPILGVFLHKKVGVKVWICALIAAVGMYFICMTDKSFSVSKGDAMVFMCAILFAVHILVIDRFGEQADGVALSCIQFFTCFVLCTIMSAAVDKPTVSQLKEGIIPILYAGILSSGVGYTFQTLGQRGVSPTIAALILSLESVVAAVSSYYAYKWGILATDQVLTSRQISGCVIVFAAVIIVQLPDFKFKERKTKNEGLYR